jgi:hypothetical protein
MSSLLNYPALLKNKDTIGMHNSTQPMSNENSDMFLLRRKIANGGSDFFLTDQNLEIVEKEHKEEKKQEPETHHGFLLTSFCSKPPPPQSPSTLLSSAPPLKPPDQLFNVTAL